MRAAFAAALLLAGAGFGADPLAAMPLGENHRKQLPDGAVQASWYGKLHHGRPTASGERFDRNRLTAAHPWLPFGSIVKVTNLRNGRHVFVKVNDRGGFYPDREIDVSEAAARKLGMISAGEATVEVDIAARAEIEEARRMMREAAERAADEPGRRTATRIARAKSR